MAYLDCNIIVILERKINTDGYKVEKKSNCLYMIFEKLYKDFLAKIFHYVYVTPVQYTLFLFVH